MKILSNISSLKLSTINPQLSTLRHRVVPAASPGVASQYAPDGESESFYRSVLQYRLPCIFRACGYEAARWRCVWRDEALVEDDRSCQQPCYCV